MTKRYLIEAPVSSKTIQLTIMLLSSYENMRHNKKTQDDSFINSSQIHSSIIVSFPINPSGPIHKSFQALKWNFTSNKLQIPIQT